MAKFKAKGVIVKAALTATPTTVVSQMADVSFDLGSRTLIDTTTHDSSVTKDYIDGGLRDTASLDISCLYDPADAVHEIIRAAHAAGTLVYVTLVLPDTGAATFVTSGFIQDFSVPGIGTSAELKMNFKFKAAGAETFTA